MLEDPHRDDQAVERDQVHRRHRRFERSEEPGGKDQNKDTVNIHHRNGCRETVLHGGLPQREKPQDQKDPPQQDGNPGCLKDRPRVPIEEIGLAITGVQYDRENIFSWVKILLAT